MLTVNDNPEKRMAAPHQERFDKLFPTALGEVTDLETKTKLSAEAKSFEQKELREAHKEYKQEVIERMRRANPNYLDRYPPEILLEIFKQLDSRYLIPLLQAYPYLGKHCVAYIVDTEKHDPDRQIQCGHLNQYMEVKHLSYDGCNSEDYVGCREKLFKIFEVSALTEEKEQHIVNKNTCLTQLPVLGFASQTCASHVVITGNMASNPCMALHKSVGDLRRSRATVCESNLADLTAVDHPPWPNYHEKVVDDFSATEEPAVPIFELPETFFDYHYRIVKLEIRCHIQKLENITFSSLKELHVSFPSSRDNQRPVLSNIKAPYLRVLDVTYYDAVPVIEKMEVGYLPYQNDQPGPLADQPDIHMMPYFKLRSRLKGNTVRVCEIPEDPRHLDRVDLSFSGNFEAIELIGGPTECLMESLTYKSTTALLVKQRYLPDEDSTIDVTNAPLLRYFKFDTVVPGAVTPALQCPGLKSIYLSSIAPGFDYEKTLDSAPLESLTHFSLECFAPTKERPPVLSYQHTERLARSATWVCLRGVSCPALSTGDIKFPRGLKDVLLELRRPDSVEDQSTNTLVLRCFRRSAKIERAIILQGPSKNTPAWKNVEIGSFAGDNLHIEGFPGSLTVAGRDLDAGYPTEAELEAYPNPYLWVRDPRSGELVLGTNAFGS